MKISFNLEDDIMNNIEKRIVQIEDRTGLDISLSEYIRSLIKKDIRLNVSTSPTPLIWTSEKIDDYLEIESTFSDSPYIKTNLGNFRKGKTFFQHTDKELEIIEMCKNDILYFANIFYKDTPLKPFQQEILFSYSTYNYNSILTSKQMGHEMIISIYLTWFLIYNNDSNILYLDDKLTQCIEYMSQLTIVMNKLPYFITPPILKCVMNQHLIITENGNILKFLSFKETEKNLDKYDLIIINNAVNYDNLKNCEKLLNDNGKIIIMSQKGNNEQYYEIMNNDNKFKKWKTPYNLLPHKDENWKNKTIEIYGIDKFIEMYEIE